MDTTTAPHTTTIVYGAAAHGGKIHRTRANGHAWCLSNNGHKPMRSIVATVEINGYANFEAEAAALIAAGAKHTNMCQKCAKTTAAVMSINEKEAGA